MKINQKRGFTILGVTVTFLLVGYFFWQRLMDVKVNSTLGRGTNYLITQKDLHPDWLADRKARQLESAEDYDLFHGFLFENRAAISGIDFIHKINPDARESYKPVHYDHGNGVIAADVNLDGFLDLYFVSLTGSGGLYLNDGTGKFSNITAGSGLELTGTKTCVTASFGDIDNDGDPDLYVSTIRDGNFLFENDGTGKFKDISETASVNYHGHSSGVVFLDYDLDGLLDIFLTNVGIYTTSEKEKFTANGQEFEYYVGVKDAFAGHLKEDRPEPSKLYHNLGDNKFEEVAESMGINDLGWCGDASIIDPNMDGYPDLYVTNMQGNDFYYENNAGKGFIDKTAALFPKTPWGAMGITVSDFDNNGLQDIYITDMHSDMLGGDINERFEREKMKASVEQPEEFLLTGGESIFGNAFYSQTEKGTFVEVSDEINAENYWPWGLSSGDLNADGFEDVFITASMNYPYRYASNSVLLNEKGKIFRDSEFILGVEPQAEFSKPWFTLDCSGKDSENPLCLGEQGEETVWGANGSRSSIIFDLDDDGDLDIVTNEFNNSPQVLVNDLSAKANLSYLKVKLVGTQSNRDGLGARVVVKTAGGTYTKLLNGKSGYLSQSSLPLYFGLNGETAIEKVAVFWPSGIKQELINPGIINDLLIINEPDAK